MLSLTEDSVTVEQVTAYATSRGRTAWLDAPNSPASVKLSAVRRATDFIAGQYNDRWLVEFEPDDVPDGVTYAIAEAAIREVEEPGALLPDLERGGSIKSIKAGSVAIEYADGASPLTVFQSIENLLVAAGLVGAISSTRAKFVLRA